MKKTIAAIAITLALMLTACGPSKAQLHHQKMIDAIEQEYYECNLQPKGAAFMSECDDVRAAEYADLAAADRRLRSNK